MFSNASFRLPFNPIFSKGAVERVKVSKEFNVQVLGVALWYIKPGRDIHCKW